MAANRTTTPTPIAIFFQVFIVPAVVQNYVQNLGPELPPGRQRQFDRRRLLRRFLADTYSLRWGDGHTFRDTILWAGKFQSGMERRDPGDPENRGCRNAEL